MMSATEVEVKGWDRFFVVVYPSGVEMKGAGPGVPEPGAPGEAEPPQEAKGGVELHSFSAAEAYQRAWDQLLARGASLALRGEEEQGGGKSLERALKRSFKDCPFVSGFAESGEYGEGQAAPCYGAFAQYLLSLPWSEQAKLFRIKAEGDLVTLPADLVEMIASPLLNFYFKESQELYQAACQAVDGVKKPWALSPYLPERHLLRDAARLETHQERVNRLRGGFSRQGESGIPGLSCHFDLAVPGGAPGEREGGGR